jgi:hypothetical protein
LFLGAATANQHLTSTTLADITREAFAAYKKSVAQLMDAAAGGGALHTVEAQYDVGTGIFPNLAVPLGNLDWFVVLH